MQNKKPTKNGKKMLGNLNSNWLSNALKSVGVSGSNIIKDMLPATTETITNTTQFVTETARDLRTASRNKNLANTIKNHELVKAGQTLLNNIKEDLRTGNLQNEERAERALMGEFDADSFEDMDFSNWEIDESSSGGSVDENGSGGDNVVVQTNVNASPISTDATLAITDGLNKVAKANYGVGQATVNTMVASTTSLVYSVNELDKNITNYLSSIDSNLAAIVEYNNQNMTRFIEASIAYYGQGSNGATVDDSGRVSSEDIFNSNKALNINSYKDYIKQNIRDFRNENAVLSMYSMFMENKDMLISNPLGFALEEGMKMLVPSVLKSSAEAFDKALGYAMPVLLERLGEWGENEVGFAGSVKQAIGRIFGIRVRRETEVNKDVKTGPMQFNGLANEAIVEIIPKYLRESNSYLREIALFLTGKSEEEMQAKSSLFDWESGEFRSQKELEDKLYNQLKRDVVTEFENTEFGTRLQSRKDLLKDEKDRELYDKALKDFYLVLEKQKGEVDYRIDSTTGKTKVKGLIDELNTSDAVKSLIEASIEDMVENNDIAIGAAKVAKQNATREKNRRFTNFSNEAQQRNMLQVGRLETYDDWVNRRMKEGWDTAPVKLQGDQLKAGGVAGGSKPDTGTSILRILQEGVLVRISESANKVRIMRGRGKPSDATVNEGGPIPPNNLWGTQIMGSTETESTGEPTKQERKGFFGTIGGAFRGLIHRTGDRGNADDAAAANAEVDYKEELKKKRAEEAETFNASLNTGFGNTVTSPISRGFKVGERVLGALMIGNSDQAFNELVTGIADIFGRLGEKIKDNFFKPIGEALFGTKDENGYIQGGIFEGATNKLRESYFSFRRLITGKGFTDSEGNLIPDAEGEEYENTVVGKIKSAVNFIKEGIQVRLFGEEAKTDEEGNILQEEKEGILPKFKNSVFNVGRSLREGLANWRRALFGDDVEGKEDEVGAKTWDEIKTKAKEVLPTALTAGIAGASVAGVSALSGGMLGTLVGGPIGGAMIGLAAGIASKSERFQTWLFGELDEEGNRTGGIIKKETQDFFAEHGKFIAGGAAIGTVIGTVTGGGLLGGGVLGMLVGGPLAGALLGTASAIFLKSDMFQKFWFGDAEEGQLGFVHNVQKLINGFGQDDEGNVLGSKIAGMMGVGALGGGALGLIMGGPVVGAALGLGAAILAQKDNFRKWLFGEEVDGVKKEGVLGKFKNMMMANVFLPMKAEVTWVFNDLKTFVKYDLLQSLNLALEPIFSGIGGFLGRIKDNILSFGESLGGFLRENVVDRGIELLGNVFKPLTEAGAAIGEAFYSFWKMTTAAPIKILSALTSPIMEGIGKVVGTIGSTINTIIITPVKEFVIKPLATAVGLATKAIAIPFKVVGAAIKKVTDIITGPIAHVVRFTTTLISDGITKGAEIIGNIVSAPFRAIKNVKDSIVTAITVTLDPIKEFIKSAVTEIKESVIKTFRSVFGTVGKIIAAPFKFIGGGVADIFRNTFNRDPKGYLGRLWRETGNGPKLDYSEDMVYDEDGNLIDSKLDRKRRIQIKNANSRKQKAENRARREEDRQRARNSQLIAKLTNYQRFEDTEENRQLAAAMSGKNLKGRWGKISALESKEEKIHSAIVSEVSETEKSNNWLEKIYHTINAKMFKNEESEAWLVEQAEKKRKAEEEKAKADAEAKEEKKKIGWLAAFFKGWNKSPKKNANDADEIMDEAATIGERNAVIATSDNMSPGRKRRLRKKNREDLAQLYRQANYIDPNTVDSGMYGPMDPNKELGFMERMRNKVGVLKNTLNEGKTRLKEEREKKKNRKERKPWWIKKKPDDEEYQGIGPELPKMASGGIIGKVKNAVRAIVGEKGVEAVYNENEGDTGRLVGTNGPQVVELNEGDRVIPNENVLLSGSAANKDRFTIDTKNNQLFDDINIFTNNPAVTADWKNNPMWAGYYDTPNDGIPGTTGSEARAKAEWEKHPMWQGIANNTAAGGGIYDNTGELLDDLRLGRSGEEARNQIEEKERLEKSQATQDAILAELQGIGSEQEEHNLDWSSIFSKKGLLTGLVLALLPKLLDLLRNFSLNGLLDGLKNFLSGLLGGVTQFGQDVGASVARQWNFTEENDARTNGDSILQRLANNALGIFGFGDVTLQGTTQSGELTNQTAARQGLALRIGSYGARNFLRAEPELEAARQAAIEAGEKPNRLYNLYATARDKIKGVFANVGDDVVETAGRETATTAGRGAAVVANAADDAWSWADNLTGMTRTPGAERTAQTATAEIVESDGILNKVSKMISDFFDWITQKFSSLGSKFGGKGASTAGAAAARAVPKSKVLAVLKKGWVKVAAKITGILTGRVSLGAVSLGTLELAFIAGGALNGLTGAARLFHVNGDAVDGKMTAISGVFGAFTGTTIGAILDVVVQLMYDMTGVDMFHSIAVAVYNALSSDEEKEALDTAIGGFEQQYLDYQSDTIEEQYKNQKLAGIIDPNMSFEEFKALALNGNKVKVEKRKDQLGNIYTQNEDGTWTVKNQFGLTVKNISNEELMQRPDLQDISEEKMTATLNTYVNKESGIRYMQDKDGKWKLVDENGETKGTVTDTAMQQLIDSGVLKNETKTVTGRADVNYKSFADYNTEEHKTAFDHVLSAVMPAGHAIAKGVGGFLIGHKDEKFFDEKTGITYTRTDDGTWLMTDDTGKDMGEINDEAFSNLEGLIDQTKDVKGLFPVLADAIGSIFSTVGKHLGEFFAGFDGFPEAIGNMFAGVVEGDFGKVLGANFNPNGKSSGAAQALGLILKGIAILPTPIFSIVKTVEPVLNALGLSKLGSYGEYFSGVFDAALDGNLARVLSIGPSDNQVMSDGAASAIPMVLLGVEKAVLSGVSVFMMVARTVGGVLDEIFNPQAMQATGDAIINIGAQALDGDPVEMFSYLNSALSDESPMGLLGKGIATVESVLFTPASFIIGMVKTAANVLAPVIEGFAKAGGVIGDIAGLGISGKPADMWGKVGNALGSGDVFSTLGGVLGIGEASLLTPVSLIMAVINGVAGLFNGVTESTTNDMALMESKFLQMDKYSDEGKADLVIGMDYSTDPKDPLGGILGVIFGIRKILSAGTALLNGIGKWFEELFKDQSEYNQQYLEYEQGLANPGGSGRQYGVRRLANRITSAQNASSTISAATAYSATYGGSGYLEPNRSDANTTYENGVPYYSQNDPRWSSKKFIQSGGLDDGATMDTTGCGPSSMAMVINGMNSTGNAGGITSPTELARFAQETGTRDDTGTNANFIDMSARRYGIDSQREFNPSGDDIRNTLAFTNAPMVLLGSSIRDKSLPFTDSGHYIVATGVDEAGNITYNDPRGRSYSGKMSADKLASGTIMSWDFQKYGGFGRRPKQNIILIGGRGVDRSLWVRIIYEVKRIMAESKLGYSQSGYMKVTIGNKTVNTRRDCTGYISACLNFYDVFKNGEMTRSASMLEGSSTMAKTGFRGRRFTGWNDLTTGDIVVKSGHGEIFVGMENGKPQVLNFGGDPSVYMTGNTPASYSTYEYVWEPGEPGPNAVDPGGATQSIYGQNASSTSSTATTAGTVAPVSSGAASSLITSSIGGQISTFANAIFDAALTGDFSKSWDEIFNGTQQQAPNGTSGETTGSNTSNTGSTNESRDNVVNLPAGSNIGSVHTYMGWQMITSPTSTQMKLRKAAQNFDAEGFGKVGDRYAVAVKPIYGDIGDYINIEQDDGSMYKGIIADMKAGENAGAKYSKYAHGYGTASDPYNVVEFVVDKNSWYSRAKGGQAAEMHQNPGTPTYHPEWHHNITRIHNVGNYWEDGGKGEGSGYDALLQYDSIGGAGLSDEQQKIIDMAVSNGPRIGVNNCLQYTQDVYQNLGMIGENDRKGHAITSYEAYKSSGSSDPSRIPPGASVYNLGWHHPSGHVAIYMGNGLIAESVEGKLQKRDLYSWMSSYDKAYDGGQMASGKRYNVPHPGFLGWALVEGHPGGDIKYDTNTGINSNYESTGKVPATSGTWTRNGNAASQMGSVGNLSSIGSSAGLSTTTNSSAQSTFANNTTSAITKFGTAVLNAALTGDYSANWDQIFNEPQVQSTTSAESTSDGSSFNATPSSGTGGSFKKYNLTNDEIYRLGRVTKQEQGSVEGAAAEASLIANRYEIGQNAQKYKSPSDYVQYSGWFGSATRDAMVSNKDPGENYRRAMVEVFMNGKRTLPGYIDEHDCISDLTSISTGSKNNRANYQPHETIIKNRYGATYRFFSFPTPGADPFGYTGQLDRSKIGDNYYPFSSLGIGGSGIFNIPDEVEMKNEEVFNDFDLDSNYADLMKDATILEKTTGLPIRTAISTESPEVIKYVIHELVNKTDTTDYEMHNLLEKMINCLTEIVKNTGNLTKLDDLKSSMGNFNSVQHNQYNQINQVGGKGETKTMPPIKKSSPTAGENTYGLSQNEMTARKIAFGI